MEWTLYWITRLESIKTLLEILIMVCVFCLICPVGVILANNLDEVNYNEKQVKKSKKWIKRLVITLLIVSGPQTLLPTTKQMAAIIILPKLAQSETVKEIPNDYKKIKDLAIDYLESKVKEE